MDPQKGEKLCEWLNEYHKITELSISNFVERLLDVVTDSKDSQLAITTAHFFHYSHANIYIWVEQLTILCKNIPLVDEDGYIIRERSSRTFLMPASTSSWEKLMGRNPWTTDFETLSQDYLKLPPSSGGLMYSDDDLFS